MQNKFSKKLAMIIVTMLTISTISVAMIPLGFSTITNRPTIYEADGVTSAAPINLTAGTIAVIDTTGMTITGAQIWLWLSTSGGSEINTALGDRPYAGPFYLADLVGTTQKDYVFDSDDVAALCAPLSVSSPFALEDRDYVFALQNDIINGTLPLMVQGNDVDYWIKISDVSPADVIAGSEIGVSTNRVHFTPGFYATPLEGAPETTVTVSGYALPMDMEYNVTDNGVTALSLLTPITHDEDGWVWTGFSNTTDVTDLEEKVSLGDPQPESTMVPIEVIENDTAAVLATFQFEQFSREVWLNGTFVADATWTYTGADFETGGVYPIEMQWFPVGGMVDVTLGGVAVINGLDLNATGGAATTFTVPPLLTGDYNMSVIDNNDVTYNFTISVIMMPSITLTPNTGYVGDTFVVRGDNFLDYVDQYLTIYFQNEYDYSTDTFDYVLMANFTCPSSTWTQTLTVPSSFGGGSLVECRNIDGTGVITDATFTVLAMLTVDPSEFSNDCSLVTITGTGLEVMDDWTESRKTYCINIDNQFMGAAASTSNNFGIVAATPTGDLVVEFVANGFRPGTHVVAIYGDSRGSFVNGDIDSYSPAAYTCFTVTTDDDAILNATQAMIDGIDLSELNAAITAVSGDVATIKTDVGTIKASLTSLSASVSSISGGMATVDTSLGQVITELSTLDTVIGSMYGDVVALDTSIGSVETSLDALDATVSGLGDDMTAVAGDVVSIDTVLGSVAGTVTSMEGTLATIDTDLGTVQVDLSYLKGASADTQATLDENLPVDMMPVWIAVILSLIAAIGAIAGVFIIQRKIA